MQEEIGAILNPGTADITDWHDEVYQTGLTQNYQVSVSNGNEKFKYYLSAGYLDDRVSFRTQVSSVIQLV